MFVRLFRTDSQPDSLDNISKETGLVAPVSIPAASVCILSIAFASYCEQLFHTILACSRVSHTNEI